MKQVKDVTILFVDDEPDLLNSLRRFLRKEVYQTLFTNSGSDALEVLASQPVDIIISDLRMPEMDGLSLLSAVKSDFPEVIRLILSASRDVEQTIEAINQGEVYRFLSKPLEPEQFKRILREVVDYHLLITGQKEMMVEIEKRLLQAFPPQNLSGVKISALMIPAGHLDGDFADYFVYDNQHVDILIGDVMGKGVQSALVAASLKHMFAKSLALHDCTVTPRAACPNFDYDINQINRVVSDVHSMCIESLLELEIFASLSYARFDLKAGQMGYVDCGHLPAIHFHAETSDCTFIKGDNMALGMAREQDYQAVAVNIQNEDVLLFYTDGVTEAQDSSGEMFGEERLANLLQRHHHLPLDDLLEAIRAEVAVFKGINQFTCIAVRVESEDLSFMGSLTVNTVPPDSGQSTSMTPLCLWTIIS